MQRPRRQANSAALLVFAPYSAHRGFERLSTCIRDALLLCAASHIRRFESHLLCTVSYIRLVACNRQSRVRYAGDVVGMNRSGPWEYHNGLLDRLPPEVRTRLKPHLLLQELTVGKVLYEGGSPQNHMYFPRSGVISLLYSLETGDTSEIAMVGNEGVVGTAVLVDSQSTPGHAIVQMAGEAFCLKAAIVEREFNRGA